MRQLGREESLHFSEKGPLCEKNRKFRFFYKDYKPLSLFLSIIKSNLFDNGGVAGCPRRGGAWKTRLGRVKQEKPAQGGLDNKGGAGTGARGIPPPTCLRQIILRLDRSPIFFRKAFHVGFPAGAKIDMESPEAPNERFGILVVLLPDFAVCTGHRKLLTEVP